MCCVQAVTWGIMFVCLCLFQKCAPGYYRDGSGPYLGRCVPCECNGLADECEDGTGSCLVRFPYWWPHDRKRDWTLTHTHCWALLTPEWATVWSESRLLTRRVHLWALLHHPALPHCLFAHNAIFFFYHHIMYKFLLAGRSLTLLSLSGRWAFTCFKMLAICVVFLCKTLKTGPVCAMCTLIHTLTNSSNSNGHKHSLCLNALDKLFVTDR